jgi:hypothetical protein
MKKVRYPLVACYALITKRVWYRAKIRKSEEGERKDERKAENLGAASASYRRRAKPPKIPAATANRP